MSCVLMLYYSLCISKELKFVSLFTNHRIWDDNYISTVTDSNNQHTGRQGMASNLNFIQNVGLQDWFTVILRHSLQQSNKIRLEITARK